MYKCFFNLFTSFLQLTLCLLQIESTMLKSHIDSLSDLVMIPWFTKFPELKEATAQLIKWLTKYWRLLTEQQERSRKRHESNRCIRSPDTNFCLNIIEASGSTPDANYFELNAKMEESADYIALNLDEYAPTDRFDRRSWFQKLQLPVPVQMFTYYYGNYLGNVCFLWKIPAAKELRRDDEVVRIVTNINKSLPKYATRAMRKRFFDRYSDKCGLQPVLLRDMFAYLSQDSSAVETAKQGEINARMAAFLATDDTDIIVDLRRLNGNPGFQNSGIH